MKNILTKIRIDYSTYILILLGLLAGYIKNIFLILMIVIVHEMGHVFFFLIFKINIEKITIYPYGGMTLVNKQLHERVYKDLFISIGGILFQLILFFIMKLLYENNILYGTTFSLFKMYNLSIIIFNMIPIIPLDGSKFIFSIFNKFLSYKDSYIMMIVLGFFSLIFFITYNFIYKLNDIVLYVFLVWELIVVIKEYKYVMNKFYLERILYNHYYNEIISDEDSLDKIRIDKFYFFKENNKFINEKDFIKRNYY